ncbi:hypothetical protein WJ87_06850 [Burkholderia ubonensis]|nr:hypothetical protein WJ87_06850 [Burkholderia ubonensis]
MAQEASSEVNAQSAVTAAAQGQLPEGVSTEKNPLKADYLTKSKTEMAVFRASDNMPEVVNEDLLRGMSDSGKAPGQVSEFIGYMPKLKVLPCAEGCEGSDYERAVADFIKGYRGNGKQFKERGEMIVQVRWYHTRPFYMRKVPYSADTFGVSFLLEGKLVSLGSKSGVGLPGRSNELARDMGARLAMELAFTLGVGGKPTFLSTTNNISNGVAGTIMRTGAAVDGVLGVEDVRSRIEPATEANANLMPAIDGIKPGEVSPITEMHYINTLLF